MHPHLHTQDNTGCAALMHALDECHARGFLHKALGGCNDVKRDVNKCLRGERIERQRLNREAGKEARERIKEKWRAIDENS